MQGQAGFKLPGNPVANAITMVLGGLALAAALVFGFAAFLVLLLVGAVFVSFVSIRLWWLRRKFAKAGGQMHGHPGRPPSESGSTIDAEYEVLSRDDKD